MANKNFLNKIIGAVGLNEDEEIEVEEDDEYEESPKERRSDNMSKNTNDNRDYEEKELEDIPSGHSKGGKLVSFKSATTPRVILKKPKEMEDMMEIVDAVKSRKIAVVNLLDVDLPLAQRMIDYVGGACYAINGKFAQISHLVYIVVGENVDLTNYIKAEVAKQTADSVTLGEE